MSDNKDYMKKALDSNINFIKRAISMEECRISKYVDRIHAILMIDDENGPYNRESISKVEFREAEAGLRESFRRVEDLHWSLNIQLSSRAEDEDYYFAEDGPCILPVQNKYCEGLKAIKKYNLACEIGQKEEVILIKGKESFENSKKVVQAALDADVNRKASTVKEESLKNKNKALGESILKETFENLINAQTNKSKTELVEPQKSQCLYGSKLMSLMDESSSINLKCEKEKAHNDPRSCPMFLKYEKKHEKLMPSLKCEENGIYNDLCSETKSFKYERKEIKNEEDGLNACNENTNATANAKDANAKDAKAIDAYAKYANAKDADAEDTDAKVAIDKVADITDANNENPNAKVVGIDRNVAEKQHFHESNLTKYIEDKLEEEKMQTDLPAIIKKGPDKDVENQFIEFLKIINIDEIKSRRLDVVKLTSRVSLQKMISFVVYTTGCITSYSVNMVRWAGRASLVIMNQEEKVSNTDISEDSNDDNYALSDSALGGSKPYKFVLLAKAALVKLVDTSILNTSEVGANLYKVRVFNVFVASLNKFLVKIWAIELEKSLQKTNQSLKYCNTYSCTTTLFS